MAGRVPTGQQLWLSATRAGNRRLQSSGMRRIGVALYRSVVSANRFLPPPRMLLNGPAKSGTHLLSDCAALLPRTMFSGRHFALNDFMEGPEPPRLDVRGLRRFLAGCPNGMFVTAHARWSPALVELLPELGYRHVLLLRDPRDILVSYASFVVRQRHHEHHRYYAQVLTSDEDRIMTSIRGYTAATGSTHGSIGDRMRAYLPWLDEPDTLVCRYETLVGERGGGSREAQIEEIGRIGAFLGRPLAPSVAETVADRMYSKASMTFRKGVIGDWANVLTPAHREEFKRIAGDVLVRFGYESGTDW